MMWYREVNSGKMSAEDLRLKVFGIFTEVGLTGMRIDAQGMAWGFIGTNTVRRSEITDDTRVEIAPMFYRVLGVTPRRFAQVEWVFSAIDYVEDSMPITGLSSTSSPSIPLRPDWLAATSCEPLCGGKG